jgi:rubrerythrin
MGVLRRIMLGCNNCSDYNATFYDTEEYDECPVCKKERDKIEIEFLSDEDMKL